MLNPASVEQATRRAEIDAALREAAASRTRSSSSNPLAAQEMERKWVANAESVRQARLIEQAKRREADKKRKRK
jgi:hypothetical protein